MSQTTEVLLPYLIEDICRINFGISSVCGQDSVGVCGSYMCLLKLTAEYHAQRGLKQNGQLLNR